MLRLLADWKAAGEPDDVLTFMAGHPSWRDLPVPVLRNTLAAMQEASDG
jgi:hypothetical protein